MTGESRRVAVRCGAFALVVAACFGTGFAVGRAVPDRDSPPAIEHPSSDEHQSGHGDD
jgi:hypothetical protein